MTIIQTIKLVLKNGYKHQVFNLETMIKDDMLDPDTINSILLNRDFWILLGRGMRWEEVRKVCPLCNCGENNRDLSLMKHWEIEWHRFIDHLASGETPEKWFENLNAPPEAISGKTE